MREGQLLQDCPCREPDGPDQHAEQRRPGEAAEGDDEEPRPEPRGPDGVNRRRST